MNQSEEMKLRSPFVTLTFLLTLVISSCQEDPSEIGSEFFKTGNISIAVIDTLSVEISTVRYDSLITSGNSRLLMGRHDDIELGEVSAASYFQIVPNFTEVPDLSNSTFSRINLELAYDGYSYYDTLSDVTFNVHRVLEEIKSSTGSFYNTTSFEFDSEVLGSLTFKPKPNTSDTLEIPLRTELGEKFYALVTQSSDEILSELSFLKYFRGLVVVPSESTNGSILGFSVNPEVKIYYIDKSEIPSVEKYFSFHVNNNYRFSEIQCEYEGGLASLTSTTEHVSSLLTNNKAYIQAGSGLALRVEVPHLKELLLNNPYLFITEAHLQLVPLLKGAETNTSILSNLSMYYVNANNEQFYGFESQAELVEDLYLGRDTYYFANISEYILQQLALQEDNENAILLIPNTDLTSTVNRIVVGNQQSEYKLKLILYGARVVD